MATEQHDPHQDNPPSEGEEAARPKDDEQLSRESIEKTGEPVRNEHGYADGAS